jgi:hypothetical protein
MGDLEQFGDFESPGDLRAPAGDLTCDPPGDLSETPLGDFEDPGDFLDKDLAGRSTLTVSNLSNRLSDSFCLS